MKFLVTEAQYKFLLKEQPTTSTAAAASKTGGGSVGKTTQQTKPQQTSPQQTKPQQPATDEDDSGISFEDYLKKYDNLSIFHKLQMGRYNVAEKYGGIVCDFGLTSTM